MKIECLTKFKDVVDDLPTTFEPGDQCTINDADGARFCANGWAKDLSGSVVTGESASGATNLDTHKSTLGVTNTTL